MTHIRQEITLGTAGTFSGPVSAPYGGAGQALGVWDVAAGAFSFTNEFTVSSAGTLAVAFLGSANEGGPAITGTVTASEVMQAAEYGYDMLKFFPAETSGGAPALKALAGPLPHITFCPTGGITPQNAGSYLSLPNVICVGSSWVASQKAVADGDWAGIEERARAAFQLRG